jgi:thioredoxin reductase (NADPH)
MSQENSIPPTGGEAQLFDLTIIGGGPVGLFAAFYAGQRQMSVKIIDSLEELGGQLMTLYPDKFVFDVGGFPKILARDLARNLIDQAMQSKPTVILGEAVRSLETLTYAAGNEPPEIQKATQGGATVYKLTSDTGVHYTRTILLAVGGGAFSPKRLPLKEAAALENQSIFYTCKSKKTFEGKRLLIVGGGDSAIDWCLNLGDVAAGGDGSGITLIHRRNQFRAHEDSIRKLQGTKTRIMTFWEIDSLILDKGTLIGAIIANSQTREKQTIVCDAILVQIGFSSSLGSLKEWPLKVDKNSIVVDSHMETNMPGVFAAGDVATFDGKLKLIATGLGEAVIAVNFAKTRIDPAAKVFPGHSSGMTTQAEHVVTV